MAELGNIQYTDLERGAVRPSEGRELSRGIGQTLDALGEWHVQDVLGDAIAEAQDVIAESREGATTALEPTVAMGSELEGEAGELQRQAKLFTEMRRKGSSSERALANLRLKDLMQKAGDAHPQLRKEIQEAIGVYANASTELSELSLIDEINADNAKIAQEELEEMRSFAADPWPTGLGIPRSVDPTSAEFARQYTSKIADWQKLQANNQKLQMAASNAAVSAEASEEILRDNMYGSASSAVAHLDAFMPSFNAHLENVAAIAEGRGDPVAAEEWMNSTGRSFELAIDNSILGVMTFWREWSRTHAKAEGSEPYSRMLALRDDYIAQLEFMKTSLRSGEKTALQMADAAWELRKHNLLRRNPSFASDRARLELMMPHVDAAAKLDPSGSTLNVGQRVINDTSILQNLENFALGKDQSPASDSAAMIRVSAPQDSFVGETPTQVRDRISRSGASRQDGFFGKGAVPAAEDKLTGLQYLNKVRRGGIQAANETPVAQVAITYLDTATGAIQGIRATDNPDPEVVEVMEEIIGDPAWMNLALVDGNGRVKANRMAFAEEARSYIEAGRPADQAQVLKSQLMQPAFNGVPYRSFVEFRLNTDSIERTSQYTYTVDRDRLRQSLEAEMNLEPTQVRGLSEDRLNAAVARINAHVGPILNKINQSVRAQAHIEAMGLDYITEDSVDYPDIYVKNGWHNFFKGQ